MIAQMPWGYTTDEPRNGSSTISRTRSSEAKASGVTTAKSRASEPTPPRNYAVALWTLLALFCLRVLGQVLVAFFQVDWLPPMPEWYSGLLPYAPLLASQLLIIALLTKVCVDFSRGRGYFVQPHPRFGTYVLWFGCLYLAVMVLRYPVRMYLHPEARWFGQTIPIFFHWVLATFVIILGLYHNRRMSGARSKAV